MSDQRNFELSVLRQVNKDPIYTDQTGNFQSYERLKQAFSGIDDDFIRLKAALRSLFARRYLRLIDKSLVNGETDIYQRYQLTPLGEEALLGTHSSTVAVNAGSLSIKQKPSREILEDQVHFSLDNLHQKIKHVSQALFDDGHYSQAIFEAYKAVVNELKDISALNHLDGKPLAEAALSLNSPKVKLNNLVTQSEKDEQQGFMLLYAGAALGVRNPKAHDNIVQSDPVKTLEYLSFASLLMRRLDERVKND